MLDSLRAELTTRIEEMRSTGVYKPQRVLSTPQGVHVRDDQERPILNLCANNYLGLADDPRVVSAAHAALDRWGFGMAWVPQMNRTEAMPNPQRSSGGSASSSGPRTRSCSAPASTPTAACSRRCSTTATR
jgi:7-keto-8-aminopelargonate synthetase-like enzyme